MCCPLALSSVIKSPGTELPVLAAPRPPRVSAVRNGVLPSLRPPPIRKKGPFKTLACYPIWPTSCLHFPSLAALSISPMGLFATFHDDLCDLQLWPIFFDLI